MEDADDEAGMEKEPEEGEGLLSKGRPGMMTT
jgi:hypothetical protein